jgi:glycosyltransferase involved in cell wall biosynthesis
MQAAEDNLGSRTIHVPRRVRRVALLTNIPAPYRLPMFRELGRRYDFEVIFDAPSEPNRSWDVAADPGFRYVYSKGVALGYDRRPPGRASQERRWVQLRYELLPRLARFRPDVIVSGEMGPRSLQAMLYARLRGIPLVLWWEGTAYTEGWVPGWKRQLRRALVRGAARFWANGRESAELLESYGADRARIDEGMIGIDTHRFSAAVRRSLPRRGEIHGRLGLEGPVLLFAGQFVPRKGVREFLAALEALRAATSKPFSVVFVGEGPLAGTIGEWCQAHPDIRARMVPFQQPDEMPPYYAAADVFVLPTLEDNWSLVALEAAAAGLPQVFSRFNGAGADLIELGAPGEVVDPADTREFSACLARYIAAPPVRATAETVARVVAAYSPEQCARRAVRSVDAALARLTASGTPRNTDTAGM